MGCWEHAALVIRGVETHKAAAAFMHSAAGYRSMLPGRAGGQRGWNPNCRTRVDLVGGVNLDGLAGALVGGGIVQGPTV